MFSQASVILFGGGGGVVGWGGGRVSGSPLSVQVKWSGGSWSCYEQEFWVSSMINMKRYKRPLLMSVMKR